MLQFEVKSNSPIDFGLGKASIIHGESAYQIAVENGFEGTEQEWLDSLKGDPFTYDDFTSEQLESLTGPAGKDGAPGKDGIDGAPGKDGYTPQKGVDYFDGAPGKDGLDGAPGKNGADGAPGYTPVRGRDYWTEADKQEIVTDVLASLPVYSGEVEFV